MLSSFNTFCASLIISVTPG
uniref:Uncharacterized protein n=1 Tax=Arundo donax TaxID=35708 RepID=A0A0A9FNA8_ARUDO